LVSDIKFRGLRIIFRQKKVDIITGWREEHNEQLHDLDSLSNVIKIIKSRMMRWAGIYLA
jgi:hypothetical protein